MNSNKNPVWPNLLLVLPIILLLLFLSTDISHAQLAPQQSDIPGLVSHWPLDTDGEDIAGSNPGIIFNGADFVEDEERGPVMQCDGENDFMAISQTYSRRFTFAGWFRTKAINIDDDEEMIPLIWSGSSQDNVDLRFGIVDGRLGYQGQDDDDDFLLGDTIVADGAWHHFALTRQNSGIVQIYVDGRREARENLGRGDLSLAQLVTFCGDLSNQTYYPGLIDDLRQYDRVLSADQIELLYGESRPTPTPTLTFTPSPTATLEPVTPAPTLTATPNPTLTTTPAPTLTVTPLPSATPPPLPTATVTPAVTEAPCDLLGTEAEFGTLFGDMAVAQGDNGVQFVHAPNVGAGDGFYTFDGSIAHRVDLCIYVDRPGFYRLTASVLALSPKDNSFYVTVNGSPNDDSARWDLSITDPDDPTQSSAFPFLVETVTGFVPENGSTQPMLLYFERGNQTITFRAREDGAMLDRAQLVVELLDDPSRIETVFMPDIRR